MTKPRHWMGALLLLMACATPVRGEEPTTIGSVKVARGSTFVVRDGGISAIRLGEPVMKMDTLRTGHDGQLGVTLHDDTRLSLAPNSELRLERFAYRPAENTLALAVRIVRGVVAYVSGQIGKLSPDAVHLETPAAIIGVRGTTLVFRVEAE